ncbi:MAG: hypothetical protein WA838_19800 [Xanthobacteraceae bacterium]
MSPRTILAVTTSPPAPQPWTTRPPMSISMSRDAALMSEPSM